MFHPDKIYPGDPFVILSGLTETDIIRAQIREEARKNGGRCPCCGEKIMEVESVVADA